MATETNNQIEPRRPNRALPSRMIDVLRIGVPGDDPKASAIWGEFVSLAMSCQRRGWTKIQFLNEMWSKETRLYGRKRSYGHWALMDQLLTCSKGNQTSVQRQLDRAWDTAGDNLLEHRTLKSTEDFVVESINNAHAWRYRLEEGDDGLSARQRSIMNWVIDAVLSRRYSKVTCPCREVGAACGMPHRTAHSNLRNLAENGFLVLHDKGKHSDDPSHWKAAIYSLPDLGS